MKIPNVTTPETTRKGATEAPLISVVIPVYNVEPYLAECLDSVRNQSLRRIEIICVNDGSTDASLDIVQKYAAMDSRIMVVDQENAGLSAARNAGMDQASGKYLYFLDSDDYLVEGALETLLTAAQTHNTDILYFGARSFFEDQAMEREYPNYVNFYKRQPTFDVPVSGDVFLLDQLRKWRFRSSVPLQLIRKEFLLETGLRFKNGISHEDELFSCLLAVKSRRSLCIREELYMRRVRANSIMTAVYTAKKFVGFFIVSTTLMSSLATEEALSADAREALAFHANKIHRDAKNTYQHLPPEEKEKIPQLMPMEYMPFYQEMSNALEGNMGELLAIQRSASYRIGRVITCLPRKIGRGLECIRQWGFGYTVRRGLGKLGRACSRLGHKLRGRKP